MATFTADFGAPTSPQSLLNFARDRSEVDKRGRPSKWPPVLPQNLQILSVRFPYNSLEKI